MGGCRGVHLQAAVPLLVGPGPTVHTLHSVLQAGAIPRYTLYVVAIATAALDTAACMSAPRSKRMMHCAGAHLPLPLPFFAVLVCRGPGAAIHISNQAEPVGAWLKAGGTVEGADIAKAFSPTILAAVRARAVTARYVQARKRPWALRR